MLHHSQFVLTDLPFCPIRQAEALYQHDEGVLISGEITKLFLRLTEILHQNPSQWRNIKETVL